MVMTRYTPNEALGTVMLDAGLEVWREVQVEGQDYRGFDIEIRVVFDGGRFVAADVRVLKRPGGPAVTSESLRQIEVAAFVRNSLEANAPFQAREPLEQYKRALFGLLELDQIARMRSQGPTSETLDWVSKVYTLAVATGDRPTKAVKEVFEIGQSTASQWVARARAQGLLGQAEPGKAG